MKKKLLSKIVVFCLIFAFAGVLAACGGNNATATTEQAATEQGTTEQPAETSETEAAEATDDKTVPSELLGTLTDTSYINETFGLRYDTPEGWYLLSREETAELMGLVTASVDEESLVEMLESSGYVTDLYAMDTTPAIEGVDSYNNVNITIQDIGKLYGTILDEKALAEASVESVKESLEAMGMRDVTVDVGESEFIGKTCVSSTVSGKADGHNMYQKQIYLKNGAAVACITATSLGEDKTDEILAVFQENRS